MENHLKELIEKDIHSNDVYYQIYELAFEYLRRNKLMNNESEYDGVATLVAEDLYMKILKGGTITSWIGYIAMSKMGFIRQYRKMTSSEIWDVSDNVSLRDSIISMCSSGSYELAVSLYNDSNTMLSMPDIPNQIESIMESHCRYNRYSSVWMNLYVSALLTIMKGSVVEYRLKEGEAMYLRVMLARIEEKLGRDVIENVSADWEGMSLFQMYLLEEAGVQPSGENI